MLIYNTLIFLENNRENDLVELLLDHFMVTWRGTIFTFREIKSNNFFKTRKVPTSS